MTESPSANPGGSASGPRRYGTFEGVFVPTLLTILGAILFLRQGWVVGNAGFGGAVLIILTAFLITGATGLSLSICRRLWPWPSTCSPSGFSFWCSAS